jgi:hypothetical protein
MNGFRAAALLALTCLAFISGCCSNGCNSGGSLLERIGLRPRRQCCPETCCPSCGPSCGGGCCGEGFSEGGPVLGDPGAPYVMPGPAPGMQDLGQPRIMPQPAQPTPAPPEMTSRIKTK